MSDHTVEVSFKDLLDLYESMESEEARLEVRDILAAQEVSPSVLSEQEAIEYLNENNDFGTADVIKSCEPHRTLMVSNSAEVNPDDVDTPRGWRAWADTATSIAFERVDE